jgi:mono/diheme cytochrome c family protein
VGELEEGAAMRKRLTLGAVLLLLSLPVAGIVRARGAAWLGLQAKPGVTDEERERLLATGKKVFIEQCAKCHDERGDKALKTGLPLNQRELSDEEIARLVAGRLKNAPDEEKRAVTLYIRSLMKRK